MSLFCANTVIVTDIISEITFPSNYPPHPYRTGSNPNVNVISPPDKDNFGDAGVEGGETQAVLSTVLEKCTFQRDRVK